MGSGGFSWGVAVARDIFVVLRDGVLCKSRSVITLPSEFVRRELDISLDPSMFGNLDFEVEVLAGDCGRELLALGFADEWLLDGRDADLDKAGEADELASSQPSSGS